MSASPSSSSGKSGGCGHVQAMVSQGPRYDNQVISRKSKIIRPDKRKRKRKFI